MEYWLHASQPFSPRVRQADKIEDKRQVVKEAAQQKTRKPLGSHQDHAGDTLGASIVPIQLQKPVFTSIRQSHHGLCQCTALQAEIIRVQQEQSNALQRVQVVEEEAASKQQDHMTWLQQVQGAMEEATRKAHHHAGKHCAF